MRTVAPRGLELAGVGLFFELLQRELDVHHVLGAPRGILAQAPRVSCGLSPQGESHAAAVVSIEGGRDGRLGGTVPVECRRHLLSPAYRPVRQFIEELEATNLEDFALSFGGGVGLMVGVGSSPWPGRLDVSVRYLRGGEADYLTEGAIRREGGQAFLDISRSPTHLVLVYIGISIGR